MIRYKYRFLLILLACAVVVTAKAQWFSHESVLAHHDWYKIGVTEDGVYGIDYATLQSWGIQPQQIDPAKIRLFGNVQGPLPESNALRRYDDLNEAAILVTGADDQTFDEGDLIVFYGQGTVNMVTALGSYFNYERNPYTDTVYYYLCVDSEVDGRRINEQASVGTGTTSPVIDIFPDYYYHESEEISPYASGRTWYGDLFTGQEGFKEFQVELPGMVIDNGVRVESRVLGRCKPGVNYNLKVNGQTLVLSHFIDAYGDREYGKEHRINKLAHPSSNHIILRYDFDPFEGNPMFFIDFFVLNYWRSLRYPGSGLKFTLFSTQLATSPAKVKVADAGSSVICWEVTNPIRPVRQLTEVQQDGLSFGINGNSERCFYLFEMDKLEQVASCRRIPNQNLHALTTAELLIITPRVFWQQAEAIADFHMENDGMNCVVADVAEIYNEFGTGTPDPTSVRDFIRMIYLRSEGALKYVLLLGKGSHDYRCIKGVDNNFVPTYENLITPYREVESMCSDDYFGLMDESEGENCQGYVDLGVGRIPITTPEQGDAVIEKIRHYADPDANHGLWKNNHLFLADNDSKTYPNNAEVLADIVDTQWGNVTSKKLYLDSYPVVSTPAGNRVPVAHQLLMDYFDKGIGVLSYTGHGGVKSLSAEWVLALADILSLTNYDKLPFIHTATCEFSKFDNPGVVSGGELLLLNPVGGAIALLTTMRPTVAHNNQKMSKSVHNHLYEKDNQQSLRFGDIYRLAKADPQHYHHDNIVYVLFGDPALRFASPSYNVVTEQVQGSDILTVTGYIADPDGNLDSQFNGELEVRLYDQKSKYTSLGLYDIPIDYSFYNDVLFEGKASVVRGRFEALIPVPSVVSQGQGMARLSYSAYDSIHKVEACGNYDDFSVQTPTTVIDNQGPDIKLYWDTPDFSSGDTGASKGTLFAELFDEHGIYHYNVSIGRDIVLNSNVDGLDNLILNDRYEPAVDDYQHGLIVLPVDELADGIYEFTLKAWDTWNNSSEATIVLVVERSMLIAEVRNYPNPFTDEVQFSFVDGELTEDLTVRVEVFDVFGHCVAKMQEQTSAVNGVVPPIHWDGSGLRSGVYLYKISVVKANGKTRTVAHTMVKK